MTTSGNNVFTLVLSFLVLATSVVQASDDAEAKPAPIERATMVSTSKVLIKDIEVTISSVGRLKSKVEPTVSVEVGARVIDTMVEVGDAVKVGDTLLQLDPIVLKLNKNAAQADIKSLKIQIANEERRVSRFQSLKKKDYLAGTQLDDSVAQLSVLRSQLEAAFAKQEILNDKLKKATLLSPIKGIVDARFVSTGDFVKAGNPAFKIIRTDTFRAQLPFPESASHLLSKGQPVELTSPLTPGVVVNATITELRPVVGSGSRAVTAIVNLTNPGGWRPDATVIAQVVSETRTDVMLVPELSIIRRPVGEVVYVIDDGRAIQKKVTLGHRTGDGVEVVSGLSGNEILATDGASFLVNGALVKLTGAQ